MPKRAFIFDAVGTVLRPIPDVATVYYEHGASFGSRLTQDEIRSRFKTARQTLFSAEQDEADPTSILDGVLISDDIREREMWYQLVQAVFADVPPIEDLFASLWEHFANPKNWDIFDDVAACWAKLREQNYEIAIGSNFDSRLHAVVQAHPILATADYCFCSAEVGFRKPDQMFYRRISEELNVATGSTPQITMIGDDIQHDVVAPTAFGWNAIWLNRNNKPSVSDIQEVRTLDQIDLA